MDNAKHIVKTARRMFEMVGIKSVSMDDISHELGMSKKTLYQYFGQKDDLVSAVLDDFGADMGKKIETFFEGGQSVWTLVSSFFEQSKSLPDIRRVPPFFYDLNKYYPALAHEHEARVLEKNLETMSRIICKGMDEGIFRSNLDVELTAMLFAKLHVQAVEMGMRDESEGVPVKRFLDFSFDVLLRGIFSTDGLKKYEALIVNNGTGDSQ